MKNVIVIAACALALGAPSLAIAQTTSEKPKTIDVTKAVAETQAIKTKVEEQRDNPRFVRTLTNVQIEVTLTDQTGGGTPDKKIVSMIASSGHWGKIRSAGTVFPIGEPPYPVQLNVDARPFVSIEGPIQLEITLEYSPIRGEGDPKVGPKQRPSGINQSQTVVMQSGKSLMVSQAADPLSDRKVTVEMKATILK